MNEPPPIPPPTPVQPAMPLYPATLGYADGSNRPARPGLVTAMGVISILLGSLGILANLVYGLYAVLFLIFAVVGPTGALNVARGAGLAPKDRTVVLGALPQLPPGRRQVLDDFLTEQGKAVFGRRVRQAADVSAAVSGSGTFDSGGVQVNWFSVNGGRLEIGDDYAAFYAGTGVPQEWDLALTAEEVDAALAAVVANARARPPDAQLGVIRRIVAGPQQAFLTPGAEVRPQIAGVIPTDKGGLMVFGAAGGLIYIAPVAGLSATSEPVEVEAPTTAPATVTPPATAPPAGTAAGAVQVKVSIAATALAVIEAVGSLGLAVYLLVIGILVFRFSRRGRRHHYWYVALKLPLIVLSVLSWWWVVMGLVQTFGPGGAGQALPSVGAISAGVLTAFILAGAMSAIYPLALLFVLRARTVREYYEGLET